MSNSLPQREGGVRVYPVLQVNESFHTNEMILKSAEAAQAAGTEGLFVVDATPKQRKTTRYIDGVLGMLQGAYPDFNFGISYPKIKGVLEATYHVRGNLLLGVYDEPMLLIDEPLGGSAKELTIEEIGEIITSPDLFTATTPQMFGRITPGNEHQIPDFLDVAVLGNTGKRPALSYDELDGVVEATNVSVAVAGIKGRDELFVLPDVDAVIISEGIEVAGVLSAQRLEGFVATALKVARLREQESAGSVA